MAISEQDQPDNRTITAKIAYPAALAVQEDKLRRERYKGLAGGADQLPPAVGFGLSGGGIRSATFCLGVFQSLAKSPGLLRRIDYISSVSGGGFFAAFYGRLFSRDDIKDLTEVEKILSPDQGIQRDFPDPVNNWKTEIFRWLRENGRYLAPNGSGDLLLAITVFLRNWITIQLLLSISLLALFLSAQLVRSSFANIILKFPGLSLPSTKLFWVSPFIYVAAAMALFLVVPLGWGYWTFALPDPGAAANQTLAPSGTSTGIGTRIWLGVQIAFQGLGTLVALALVLLALGLAIDRVLDHSEYLWIGGVAVVEVTFLWWQYALVRSWRSPPETPPMSALAWTLGRWAAFALIALLSLLPTRILIHFFRTAALSQQQVAFDWRTFVSGSKVFIAHWLWFILAGVILVLVCSLMASDPSRLIDQSENARTKLSQWLKAGFVASLAILFFALLDSVGQFLFALRFTPEFTPSHWLTAIIAAVAAIVPFAHSITSFFTPKKGRGWSLPLSLLAAGGALLVYLPFLITLDSLSHAIAYDFAPPAGAPQCLVKNYYQPKWLACDDPKFGAPAISLSVSHQSGPTANAALSAASSLVYFPFLVPRDNFSEVPAYNPAALANSPESLTANYTGLHEPNTIGSGSNAMREASVHPQGEAEPGYRSPSVILGFLIMAVLFVLVTGFPVGPTARTFLNRTSLHSLYYARLVRAYLGASNKYRHSGNNPPALSDPIDGDDIDQEAYWRPSNEQFWGRGAPLHLVNVTINETIEGRSQTEQRDRKGVGMAIGPAGFSVGVQHHVAIESGAVEGQPPTYEIFPKEKKGFRVFDTKKGADIFKGQRLPLGRWTAISGAAVSTGLGSRNSLGASLLTGFFNVRLGYWWNSGTRSIAPGHKPSRELGRFFAWFLPIQSSLLDEFLGRFRGTARKYWYLTDGGHFENMAGYELIRRRLPLIVLIDCGADPDYDFEDLANLIRKARLDFNAEIEFLDPDTADKDTGGNKFDTAAADVARYFKPIEKKLFGTIDQLRRGKWASEPIPDPDPRRQRFFKSSNPDRLSVRHAALATVTYLDDRSAISYLILLKPSLIGEEPQDLTNYHSANPTFPQQTTAEQFFDEAQWESYRRLGQHITERVFRL